MPQGGTMIDIIFALAFAGCVYGIARALGRDPGYRRVAWWTVAGMFCIAAYGELKIVRSGEGTPEVGHVLPLVILGGVLYAVGRGMEWYADRRIAEGPEPESQENDTEVPELQIGLSASLSDPRQARAAG
jgi:hypothetical protein